MLVGLSPPPRAIPCALNPQTNRKRSTHLVPHQQPLLYAPEGHLLLLQLRVDAGDGCARRKVAVDQLKHVLGVAAVRRVTAQIRIKTK